VPNRSIPPDGADSPQALSDLADAPPPVGAQTGPVLPLSDGIPARRFPIVNIAIIVANFAVWLFYELPHLDSAVEHASFYPCSVVHHCQSPEPWGVSWITAMFLHGSWDHILGNMLFLALFGAPANGGGVAFFAHVGGFVFGVLVAWLLTSVGRVLPQTNSPPARVPA
jgi:membrane associated rhomboid family serine protease